MHIKKTVRRCHALLKPTAGYEIVCYADRMYGQMEQVYLSYGKRSNQELLLLYGARKSGWEPSGAAAAVQRRCASAAPLAGWPH